MGGVLRSPFNAPSAAAKAAVQAFANTLRLEVRNRGVGAIYFGLIATRIDIEGVKHPLIAPIVQGLPPRIIRPRRIEEAVRAIVDAIQNFRRAVVFPKTYGPPVRVADFFQQTSERQLRLPTAQWERLASDGGPDPW